MRRSFYAFSAFIIISFLVLGGVLSYLAHSFIHQTTKDKIIRDLEILSTITQGALAYSDYERIEEQVLLWGEKDSNIIVVRVILDNDSPIVEFTRETQTSDILRHAHTVLSLTGRSVTFEILYDLAEQKRNTLRLAVVFFSLSGCVAVGFIFSLWMILQRLAILPLQREVINRKLAEASLRESEEKYRSMMESMKDPVYICSADYRVEYMNPAMIQRVGRNAAGEYCFKVLHDLDGKCPWCMHDTVQQGESSEQDIVSPKDNRSYHVTYSPIAHANGSISKLTVFRDITRGKEMQLALKEAGNIINRSPAVAFLWKNTEGWPVEFVSENVKNLFGYSADDFISGKISYAAVVHPDDLERVQEEVSTHSNKNGKVDFAHQPYRIITRKGDIKWLDDRTFIRRDVKGNISHYEGIVIDITDKKKFEVEKVRLESLLQQAQKMEAIGTLAGGVAHDFNNILTAIIGNAELALMEVGKDDPLRGEIEGIKLAGSRAAALTRQLLAFSRKQIIQPVVLNLNELLTRIDKMLGRLIGEDVEILMIQEPSLWRVEVDSGQVEQVIINLAVNARDAMPKGGKLTIETANVDLDEHYFYKHAIEEQPGPYVMMAVSDTGTGMDNETQSRIFEPFFTTKGTGKGTGLGLSTVYGIVKQNSGFVWIYSEPGQGSTFKVYLPKVRRDVEAEEKERTPVVKLDGSETVLVVEDDDSIRNLSRKALQQRGYRVLVAENGEDAFRVSEEHGGSIQLMITDVVMPKMSGKETAERFQPLHPQMKVIYMSGYTDDAIVHHGVLAAGLNFIEKPFTPEGLARKVREVLDKKEI